MLELGGITEQTFAEVGAPYDIRMPKPPILYRIGGKGGAGAKRWSSKSFMSRGSAHPEARPSTPRRGDLPRQPSAP
ncbi:hypothetical protein [Microtetraspora niveoalba]|uniref:hypothetical protein n=1 Tax=Microtetraspora niveoalba TaxID=46175 RepID=UPI001FDFF4C7|nr:hypothetical protein [Microtetraspora niveoalba]